MENLTEKLISAVVGAVISAVLMTSAIALYQMNVESKCANAGIVNIGDYVMVCHHVDDWNVNE